MDRLTSMAAFVAAADLGSFAAGAAALGMSPQMVAKHVAFLEARLGTRLINRTTRRQSLTEFGRAYHERCRVVLAEAEAADALAETVRAHPHGTLRLNAPVTFGSHGLVPLLTRYLRDCPQVEVDLSLADRLVDPLEEGFEAVIRLGPLAESSLVARPLAPYRLVACAAPAYLGANGVPSSPADLSRHQCLDFSHWPRGRGSLWQFTRAGQTVEAPAAGRLRINDFRALLSAARDGFGIVLGVETALRDDLAAGRLVRVLPDWEAPSRPMHLLTMRDRRPTAKLRRFIEMMLEEFGPDRSAVRAASLARGPA
ncbi:LysR family transcriptional regulator [Methylobacterium sp. 17Sr1-1]|uniref:LysR family transcriptional regulator n=1 Tax=Methylobacterium sp. 17Sr1-1 TaxID=2202826 RepID=UPI000D6FF210|nr:LysR family transcriptional regulator [Methylobacterium sp. 17Sr1-1]AWN50965.1 LysR family transcriptional regulator [Methylobacterium sp. 17Sr1-1]